MKNLLILAIMLLMFKVGNTQISEIYNSINSGKELVYSATNEGCLTISKNNIKQSYSEGCAKPIDFTITSINLKNNRINISMTMHYYGDVKLVGFLEIKDNCLVLSYGKSSTSEQQVDKYKLK